MDSKGVFVIVALAAVICIVQGFPRDSSVLKTQEITSIQDVTTVKKDQDCNNIETKTQSFPEVSKDQLDSKTQDEPVVSKDQFETKIQERPEVSKEQLESKTQNGPELSKDQLETKTEDGADVSKDPLTDTPTTSDKNEVKIPGRVSCKFEEATEDLVCQEHCLPKGYSYGLCVGYKCSCI